MSTRFSSQRLDLPSDATPIWGGRFQPPHVGHEYITKTVLSRFYKACVALVNPDPSSPPIPPKEFPRFDPIVNPLTFFERLILWSRILQSQNLLSRTAIMPTWHPRISLTLENEFLPPKSRRFWVVPVESDEEWMKIKDFEALGERVFTDFYIPHRVMGVSSSEIRKRASEGRPFSRLLPAAIRDFGLAAVQGGVDRQGSFKILPFIEEVPNIRDVIGCMPALDQANLAIALPINVQNSANWWFKLESPRHVLTYYERHMLTVELFLALAVEIPLITPMFYMKGEPTLVEAFLPHRDVRSWLIPSTPTYDRIIDVLSRAGETIEMVSCISHYPDMEKGAQVAIQHYLDSLHFRERTHSATERRNVMSGIRFGQITIVEGNVVNVEGDQSNLYGTDASLLAEKVRELLQSVAEGRSKDTSQQVQSLEKLTLLARNQSIRNVVEESVKTFSENNPKSRSKIAEWAKSFMISAAGSGLVAMIQEAVKLLHN